MEQKEPCPPEVDRGAVYVSVVQCQDVNGYHRIEMDRDMFSMSEWEKTAKHIILVSMGVQKWQERCRGR